MKEHTPASKDVVQKTKDAGRQRPGSRAATAQVPAPPTMRAPVPVDLAQAFGGSGDAPFVQRESSTPRFRPSQEDPKHVHEAAARGTAGAGTTLPYVEQIQRSFGRHDVSGVRAYTGQAATAAAESMGAAAYTTGNRVAFAGSPSLHTAAHEAAHTVQQRGGVQLAGGVGQVGDPYERHADAVADAVVAGRSAEPILDSAPRSSSAPVGQASSVQKLGRADAEKAALLILKVDKLSAAQTAKIPKAIEQKLKEEKRWDDGIQNAWKQPIIKAMEDEEFIEWIGGTLKALVNAKKPSRLAKRGAPNDDDKEAYNDAIGVPQGFYYVIDSESEAKSLFTTGAGPCSAVALYTKCLKSEKEVYAVAHIDAANDIEEFVKKMIAAVKAKAGEEIGPIDGVVSTMAADESGLEALDKVDASKFEGQPTLQQNTYKYVIPLLKKHGVVISAVGNVGEVWMGKGYKTGVKAMPLGDLGGMVKSKETAEGIKKQIQACLKMQKEQGTTGISIKGEDRTDESPKVGINRGMNECLIATIKLNESGKEDLATLKEFIKENKNEMEKTAEGAKLVKWAG